MMEETPACVLGSLTCGNASRQGEQLPESDRSLEVMEYTESVR